MITVTWDDDAQTIIMWHFAQRWTVDDFVQANNATRAMIEAQEDDVDVIVDLRHSSHMPSNILSLAANALRLGSPQVRLVVVISHNSLWDKMLSAFNQIYTSPYTRIQLVREVEDAYNLIRARR